MSTSTGKNTKRIFLSPPHLSGKELDLVKEAFDSNYIAPIGPQLDQFEQKFIDLSGIPHCVAVANGTSAIHLMLRSIGIKSGDLVLASTLTFIGSVAGATYLGAELGFVDCDYETWNMDIDLLAQEIDDLVKEGRRPAAVLPTENYGQGCDVDRLREVCDRHEIPLVLDCAETVGAQYKGKHVGHGAAAASFSFNGNKIVTTSGGGIVASHNKELVDRARHLANQAKQPGWQYEHIEVGYNYRLSNILAALGIAQLDVIEERVQRKREIFDLYASQLGTIAGLTLMPEAPYGKGNRWLTAMLVDPELFGASNIEIMEALEEENIESRPVWRPMHLQKVFAGCRVAGGKVSENINHKGICLPSGTAMSDEDVARVCSIITKLGQKKKLAGPIRLHIQARNHDSVFRSET